MPLSEIVLSNPSVEKEREEKSITLLGGQEITVYNLAKSCKQLSVAKTIPWVSSVLLSKEQATREARLPFKRIILESGSRLISLSSTRVRNFQVSQRRAGTVNWMHGNSLVK